jgi:hypothetical protein
VLFINTFNASAFRSDDKGATWKRLEGYYFKRGHHAIPDPNHEGMIYMTTFGGSVWYGPDTGIDGAFEGIYPYR